MKNTPSAGHDASADKEMELMRGINRRDEQAQAAAALLLLMGNELVRLTERGESWSDESFGEFIACGLISISHQAARNLHQATLP